jgi:hypothetical protein
MGNEKMEQEENIRGEQSDNGLLKVEETSMDTSDTDKLQEIIEDKKPDMLTQDQDYDMTGKPKKRHGCLVAILVFFAVLAVAGIVTYLCMPGLYKPNNLGVKASQEAYDSAMRKLTTKSDRSEEAISTETVNEEYSASFIASDVNAALTSEEITSLLTINRPDDYPLQETQVRLNEDDTMEISSSVSVDFLLEDLLDNEITKEEIADAVPILKSLPEDVNLYIKLNADVEGNEIGNLDIEKLSVMGVTIPESMIGTEDAGDFLIDSINNYLENKTAETGERFDTLKVQDGSLIVEGNIMLQ